MSVARGRQAANGNDGVNESQGVKAGTIDGVGGNVERVVCGATYYIYVVEGDCGTQSPTGFGQHLLRLLPGAYRAVVVELGDMDFVYDAAGVMAAHHDEVGLGGHHRHVAQANGQSIQFCPARDAIVLLRGAIHFAHVAGAVVATHEVNIVAPSHHLVSFQALR